MLISVCMCVQSSEVLLAGRRMTAMEACQCGLVSQVFWPTSLMQEVVPRLRHMADNHAPMVSLDLVIKHNSIDLCLGTLCFYVILAQ